MSLTSSDIQKLFQPTEAIRERSEYFVGRSDLLEQCEKGLMAQNSSLVIYGERGVGKTSLAFQLRTRLSHSSSPPTPGGSNNENTDVEAPPPAAIVWHESAHKTKHLTELLLRILQLSRNPESFSAQFPMLYEDTKLLEHIRLVFGLDLLRMTRTRGKLEGQSAFCNESMKELQETRLAISIWKELTSELENAHSFKQITLFIDELDRVDDTSGLGELIKASGPMRFVLIGVANRVEELVTDHESVVRKLTSPPVQVPTLSKGEIQDIFAMARKFSKNRIEFTSKCIASVVDHSYGFPWLAQRLGFESTMLAWGEQPSAQALNVDQKHVKQALNNLVEQFGKDVRYYNPYQAVGSTTAAEVLLALSQADEAGLKYHDLEQAVSRSNRSWLKDKLRPLLLGERSVLIEKNERYRFREPLGRIIYRLQMEQDGKPATTAY